MLRTWHAMGKVASKTNYFISWLWNLHCNRRVGEIFNVHICISEHSFDAYVDFINIGSTSKLATSVAVLTLSSKLSSFPRHSNFPFLLNISAVSLLLSHFASPSSPPLLPVPTSLVLYWASLYSPVPVLFPHPLSNLHFPPLHLSSPSPLLPAYPPPLPRLPSSPIPLFPPFLLVFSLTRLPLLPNCRCGGGAKEDCLPGTKLSSNFSGKALLGRSS